MITVGHPFACCVFCHEDTIEVTLFFLGKGAALPPTLLALSEFLSLGSFGFQEYSHISVQGGEKVLESVTMQLFMWPVNYCP